MKEIGSVYSIETITTDEKFWKKLYVVANSSMEAVGRAEYWIESNFSEAEVIIGDVNRVAKQVLLEE